MSLHRKTRILTVAVFIALVVANVQSVFAQKAYHIYTLAETFGEKGVEKKSVPQISELFRDWAAGPSNADFRFKLNDKRLTAN